MPNKTERFQKDFMKPKCEASEKEVQASGKKRNYRKGSSGMGSGLGEAKGIPKRKSRNPRGRGMPNKAERFHRDFMKTTCEASENERSGIGKHSRK
eukprot:16444977-Heterocapsa_arctica.AAC.2